jgi:hypothetical protein
MVETVAMSLEARDDAFEAPVCAPACKKAKTSSTSPESDASDVDSDDRDVPCMSQVCFGTHTLDPDYRRSMPPFYTTEMVVSTFLGNNKDHP